MSPKRWGTTTRIWAYRYLVERDGDQCARCYTIPTTLITLDIDHIDGNKWNNDPDNLRLLCRKCNVILENKARPTTRYEAPSDPVCVREREEGKPSTRIARQLVDYRQGDSAMQANFLFELDFRMWLLDQVRDRGFIPQDDAINAGAEVVGCSPSTTARYLAKLTSSAGPLKKQKDMLGCIVLSLRDGLLPEPSIKIDLDKGETIGKRFKSSEL
jgi:hypothetical protein